jgi:cytochrome c553
MPTAAEPRPARPGIKHTNAPQLYAQGDAARKLPACASCHGEDGKGTAGAGPVIGGQGRHYLAQQLQNWRDGSRKNSAGGVMNQLATPLSDEEIEALASYVSSM